MASYHLHLLLSASGETVGLPKGEMVAATPSAPPRLSAAPYAAAHSLSAPACNCVALQGNSEVGHLTMGAGRSSPQELLRIEKALSTTARTLSCPPCRPPSSAAVDGHKHAFHLIGLLSDGGVHSHIQHLLTIIQVVKQSVPDPSSFPLFVHAITDGRDTPPQSAYKYIQQLQDSLKKEGVGQLATLIGRHYAMDRDKRWDRVQAAYDLYTQGKGEHVKADAIEQHLKAAYDKKTDDQTLTAVLVDDKGKVEDGDEVFFFNFRNDRMKEICGAMLGQEKDVHTSVHPHVLTMTQYDETFKDAKVLFPFHPVAHSLPEVLSKAGLRQFHCAETEKYAHVTFFFSGGKEEAVKGEERKLIPSPKVDTYDQQPEMSCAGVADAVVAALQSDKYDFIVCNLAAADMVGHTGKYEATVKACEAVDEAVGKIAEVVKAADEWVLMVTGDHGNAEEMLDEKGGVKTSHTSNPVPLIVVGKEFETGKGKGDGKEDEGKEEEEKGGGKRQKTGKTTGGLNDIAPTILALLGVEQPKEMTGHSLLPH